MCDEKPNIVFHGPLLAPRSLKCVHVNILLYLFGKQKFKLKSTDHNKYKREIFTSNEPSHQIFASDCTLKYFGLFPAAFTECSVHQCYCNSFYFLLIDNFTFVHLDNKFQ